MAENPKAQKIALEVLDKWLDFQSRYGDVPGYQISIRKKGKLIFSKAYGYANMAKKIKYTPDHVGRIASHSKLFTSCLALQLQNQGMLAITDAIHKYLPEFSKHKDKRYKEITIRDLMNNRSGIYRDGLDSTFWDLQKPFLSRKQLLDDVLKTKLVYEPNTHTKYSNIGHSVLGIVLEKAAGKSFDRLVNEYIFAKLPKHKLATDYGIGKDFKYADGHSKKFYDGARKIFKHSPSDALVPAGGFCGNTDSTTLFLHELYFGDKLLDRHTRRDLVSMNWLVKNASTEFYGLGTQFNIEKGNTYIGHSGGYPGFISQTRYVEGTDYIIGVIGNCNDFMALTITRSIYEILKSINALSKKELDNVTVSETLLSRWGSMLYVVSDKKAWGYGLETWALSDSAYMLEKRKDGLFYTDDTNGYGNVGEGIKFSRDKKKIISCLSGGFIYRTEKEFLKISPKGFVA